jgi:PAS domain S-box-containing protein
LAPGSNAARKEETPSGSLTEGLASANVPDELDLSSVRASGVGTWELHAASNTLHWSRQTARIFGLERTFCASYDTFLERVHPDERREVAARMAGALESRGGTFLEFRIRRQDGATRWVVVTAVTPQGDDDRAARLLGVVFDVTDRRGRSLPPREAPGRTFSTREAAQLLGVSEAGLKRLTASGKIGCLRGDRRGTRRFGHEHLVAFLLRGGRSAEQPSTFVDAAAAFSRVAIGGQLEEAVALLIQLAGEGHPLELLADELVAPLGGRAKEELIESLLERIAVLGPFPGGTAQMAALVIPVGRPDRTGIALVRCILRSRGIDALAPSDRLSPAAAAQVAVRFGARLVTFVMSGDGASGAQEVDAIRFAGPLASTLPVGSVCAYGRRLPDLPAGVVALRSMRDLARTLDAADEGGPTR